MRGKSRGESRKQKVLRSLRNANSDVVSAVLGVVLGVLADPGQSIIFYSALVGVLVVSCVLIWVGRRERSHQPMTLALILNIAFYSALAGSNGTIWLIGGLFMVGVLSVVRHLMEAFPDYPSSQSSGTVDAA
ncbi:sugar porter family MFS transporter [Brevibacterium aurantiacum]|uniref:Sugar porter family MFS transporter n=1 Tax=Brevibacterium aurantiacum TaxID=273384 RepID=A0A556C482_BREAU|nr:sugar porter family MFS transporter [Brevibacterium aurantiacum]TSI12254.1 sugar porter family MFS transporter [Brevibacterium aurantiacum]